MLKIYSLLFFIILLLIQIEHCFSSEINSLNAKEAKLTETNKQIINELFSNNTEFHDIYLFFKYDLNKDQKIKEMKNFLKEIKTNNKQLLLHLNNYNKFSNYLSNELLQASIPIIKKEKGKKSKKPIYYVHKAEELKFNILLLSLSFCENIDEKFTDKEIKVFLNNYCSENILEKANEVLKEGDIIYENEIKEENHDKIESKQDSNKTFGRTLSKMFFKSMPSKILRKSNSSNYMLNDEEKLPKKFRFGTSMRKANSEGDVTKNLFIIENEYIINGQNSNENIQQQSKRIPSVFNNLTKSFRRTQGAKKESLDVEEQIKEEAAKKSVRTMSLDDYLSSCQGSTKQLNSSRSMKNIISKSFRLSHNGKQIRRVKSEDNFETNELIIEEDKSGKNAKKSEKDISSIKNNNSFFGNFGKSFRRAPKKQKLALSGEQLRKENEAYDNLISLHQYLAHN